MTAPHDVATAPGGGTRAARFAEVCVLVSKAPSLLTWAIPAALSDKVQVGVRVVVPLSGRRVTGVLLGVVEAAPAGVTPSLIMEVLDDTPVVSDEQLQLARFVARYYLAPLQDALRLVLPPDTLTAPRRRFKLTERGERAKVFFQSEGLTAADVALLQAFEPDVVVEAGRLRGAGGTKPRLQRLLDRTLIQEVRATAPVTRVRTVEHISPCDDGQAIPKAAHALAACDAWLRAFVTTEGRPATMAEVDVAVGHGRGKIKKLEALGRVRVEHHTRTQQRLHTVAGKGAAHTLTEAQQAAVDAIGAALVATNDPGGAFLLEGVTGSGKTEVYLAAVRQTLELGKSALLLVPEIALTPQLVARVEASFAETVVVLHSGLSEAERRDGLQLLRDGKARVAVGARSAIFAPCAAAHPFGLIVVDEEHEPSLKQDDLSPRYHARDVALWRAHQLGAVVVLGSATPSLESRHNASVGKLTRLVLPSRVGGGGALPTIEIVDLKQRKDTKSMRRKDRAVADDHGGTVLSGPLVEAMAETLAAGEQALLFLNRRGWSSTISCDQCGEIRHCPQCAVALTLHRGGRPALRCHQCGYAEPFVEVGGQPPPCPSCGQDGLVQLGTGTERVEAEVRARFPDARLARLDRDAARDHKDVVTTINAIQRGEVDIVIGTQMIAKGHDWPAVKLVGIVSADVALALPDFRAAERAMSLLTQVAGRAGRGGSRGRVIVQTYDPGHPVIMHLVSHDVASFAALELTQRQQLHYPPFSRLCRLRLEHPEDKVCFELMNDARAIIERLAAQVATQTTTQATTQTTTTTATTASSFWRLSGPAPCPIERLQGRARVQLVFFAADPALRQRVLLGLKADERFRHACERHQARFIVDVDPVNML